MIQGPVSQSYLTTKICLKIKICHKIVVRFILAVSQNFHILSNKSDLTIILRSVLRQIFFGNHWYHFRAKGKKFCQWQPTAVLGTHPKLGISRQPRALLALVTFFKWRNQNGRHRIKTEGNRSTWQNVTLQIILYIIWGQFPTCRFKHILGQSEVSLKTPT
jgi:hypothetical protein